VLDLNAQEPFEFAKVFDVEVLTELSDERFLGCWPVGCACDVVDVNQEYEHLVRVVWIHFDVEAWVGVAAFHVETPEGGVEGSVPFSSALLEAVAGFVELPGVPRWHFDAGWWLGPDLLFISAWSGGMRM
jgi:hypothetical protein